jgi:hypothetical protein
MESAISSEVQTVLAPFGIYRCGHCEGLNIAKDKEHFQCAWCQSTEAVPT